ncbi:Lon protease family protein [Pseudazoarcus pumilus]|uniref:endopeptidase La n=1 Tax=Pseudazoarcus pumilus TaxID=2067960 RepID=A0A2I6S507_9RHOO|nr:AAA family ATPase [Pseudazoarcus pumilus]AUN94343.1 ATP-dependent protease [Pseudazoarcus pumilus]
MTASTGLPAERLRTRCDPESLPFETTATLEDLPDDLEQARADEALRFGLAMTHSGYNVYVLGESGTGRHAIVGRLLAELAAKGAVPSDQCYVYNFDDPQRPHLLALPAGWGNQLRLDMQTFVRDLAPAIDAALSSDAHESRIEALQDAHKEREEGALQELGEQCAADALALLRTPEGFVFAPTKDGETMSPEDFDALPKDERERIETAVGTWSERLADLLEEFPGWRKALRESICRAERDALAPTVAHLSRDLRDRYRDILAVQAFLDAVHKDLLDSGIDWGSSGDEDEGGDDDNSGRFQRYLVKLLVDHADTQGAPVVYEDNPGFGNLIGRIEHVVHMGNQVTNFQMIRAGSLHRANGGYLILDAERLFAQPWAWDGLKRSLRSGEIRIEPPAEAQGWNAPVTLEPQPVPCRLKVVLIGSRELFYLLTDHDPDFAELFKVAADFDDEMPRTPQNVNYYAHLLAMLARNVGLLPLDREAVARLVEQGARLAEDAGRLSLYTRKLADLMREADHYAREAGLERVGRLHIDRAIAARARRFGRYSQNVLESIVEGSTLISTDGRRSGQVNGLVVVELAGEHFGHPVRITATARLGDGEVVDIERETELGGAIHTKGVMILTAFLAARYARNRPLSLNASLVFEQSYGYVEGDSASLAELCALLSALADVPLRQGLAITGSVNQFGEAQVIGGVNEKIEGFFDLCAVRGLTGDQGVLIPSASVRHLMLREDVVEAVRRGTFHVYTIDTVDDAMTLLTGMPAGTPDAKGAIPKDTINHRVAVALETMATAQSAWSSGRGAAGARRSRQVGHWRQDGE